MLVGKRSCDLPFKCFNPLLIAGRFKLETLNLARILITGGANYNKCKKLQFIQMLTATS